MSRRKKKKSLDADVNIDSSPSDEMKEIKRFKILLDQKLVRNDIGRTYNDLFNSILEDVLLMEYAQKSVELGFIYKTKDSLIKVDEAALNPFRIIMENMKYLSLIRGLCCATGNAELFEPISKAIIEKVYGPVDKRTDSSTKLEAQLKELDKILTKYTEKVQKL